MARCADSNCGYYWQEAGEPYPRCHYDDPWPAPCEYDDDAIVDESYDPGLEPDWELGESAEKSWNCAECTHSGQETTDDVACCNCCEDGEFFDRRG